MVVRLVGGQEATQLCTNISMCFCADYAEFVGAVEGFRWVCMHGKLEE
jgi:hypothetical protein